MLQPDARLGGAQAWRTLVARKCGGGVVRIAPGDRLSLRGRPVYIALMDAGSTTGRDDRRMLARLWREWVSPHRGTIALVLVFIGTGAAANAAYPLLVREAFNLLDAKDFDSLAYAPLVVIVATAARGGSLYFQTLLTNRFVTRIETEMQTALYDRLVEADLAQLQTETVAALTQRFTTDFAYIKEALARLFTVFLRDVATLVALVGVLLWIDWRTTLVAAVIAPFVVPPIARIGRRLRRIATATQEEIGSMAASVAESLAGARLAKSYRLEEHLKARARRAFGDIRTLRMTAADARARMDPILEIGAGLAIAGVIAFVGWRIQAGQTSLGDFGGYSGALLMAAQPVRTLGNLNAIVQEALAALTRTFEAMDRRPAIVDRPDAERLEVETGRVTFRDVSFSYGPGRPVLSDVSFVAEPGRTTALVGRSGSGKSTLLSLVTRLHDCEAGAVLIDGTDVRHVTLASLRDAVAVVSQDVLLFDDTVAANIGYGRFGAPAEAIEAAAHAAAADVFIRQLPDGYATRVGEGGSRLSGGQRQRVALARAFLKDAPILLLDEATSALDAESEMLVQDALRRLMHNRTTIVIAHRLATIRGADHIVVMDQGRVTEEGKHADLVRAGGLYCQLVRLQGEGASASFAPEQPVHQQI